MKKFLAIIGSALMGLMFATSANAANPEPVPVDVEWIGPISITKTVNLQFGLLALTMLASDTVTVNPDDSFSESATNIVGGTKAAARLTITAVASKAITITADSPTNGTYYTLDTFTCRYNGAGSDSACTGGYSETSAATATLLVGAKLTGLGGALAGTDPGSFDVTIVYQ